MEQTENCWLTLSGKQLSAHKGSIHILQKNDALLRRHAQEMVQTVIWKGTVAQTQETDAVAEVTCQCRAERNKK